MTAHVACVGDLMVDVMAYLPGPLAPGSDTPAPISVYGGGAATNVAAWLASVGTAATFVGRVGDDALGRMAVDDLTAAGVAAAVRIDPLRPTGTCIVLVDADGERTMIPNAGANAGLGELDAAAILPPAADCLYLSGYALLGVDSRPFGLAALECARARGWTIAVDAASAAPLAAVGADAFSDWLGRDLVLFANSDEARVLTGADGVAAAMILGARFGEAVVKLGEAGAVWSDGTQQQTVPARPTDVLNTTGAGDAFSAGFLAARLAGRDVAGCLTAGAELGSRAVAQPGARPVAG